MSEKKTSISQSHVAHWKKKIILNIVQAFETAKRSFFLFFIFFPPLQSLNLAHTHGMLHGSLGLVSHVLVGHKCVENMFVKVLSHPDFQC